MSALSELLQAVADRDGRSSRQRAALVGDRISHATISAYQRGDHARHPEEHTLRLLAEAYGLPLAQIQAAAGVPVGAGDWRPPPEVSRLTARQQAALTELIMAMANDQGSGETDAKPA